MGERTIRAAVVAVRQPTLENADGATNRNPLQAVDKAHALVYLKPSTFRLCWFSVVGMHLFCAGFVISVAIVYLYMRQCIVINTINTYSIAIDMHFWVHVAVMYLCIAVVHLWYVARILVRSFCARSLVFRLQDPAPPSITHEETKPAPRPRCRSLRLAKQVTVTALQRAEQVAHPRVSKSCKWIWKALVAYRGSMNVRSENYGLFFLSRGVWQTILQSHQAYRLAGLLPRVWMNTVIVTLVIGKCWSTTIIHYIFPHNIGKLRLACVMVSLALDVAAHAAIPLALVHPYLQDFNYEVGDFALELWYTDVWFAEIINEAQLLFVTSWGDAFSKFMVAMSLAKWLNTITQLVRILPSDHMTAVHRAASITPADTTSTPQPKHIEPKSRSLKDKVERSGQRLLFVWGVVVLASHLHSASVAARPQCLLRTRPWFTSKPSCSLLGYDCHQEKSIGSEAEVEEFLNQFDLNRVGFMVISECPRLQFPPIFRDLHELVAMKLFRSTIERWNHDTALTKTNHPKFLSIFLADLNMTEMPAGLLSPPFPPKFMDIQIVQTNMTRLPDNLASVWPQNMILILENSQFHDFPAVLQYMAPTFLSLAKNNISPVPAEVLEAISPVMLFLSGNPVQALPSKLNNTPATGWF